MTSDNDALKKEIAELRALSPRDLLRRGADYFAKGGEASDRRHGIHLQILAVKGLLIDNGIPTDELAPLHAISEALRDLTEKGIRSELLDPATVEHRPSQAKTGIENRQAMAVATVDKLIAAGTSPNDAERRVARTLSIEHKKVANWRKKSKLSRNYFYQAFRRDADAVSPEQMLALLKAKSGSMP